MKNKIKKFKEKIALISAIFFLFMDRQIIYAGSKLANSDLGKGLQSLLKDASTYLLVLSPIIGAICAIYFFIRKNGADEQDQKAWNKRLITTVICVLGAVLLSSIVSILADYFGVDIDM